MTVKLSRRATVALKLEMRVKRKGRWVWTRVTSKSLTATASGRSLTIRGKSGRSLAKGPYRVTASLSAPQQDGAQLPRVSAAQPCRLGVLALGDSITNGGGELQWGVALQSWALWVARGLGLPFTTYAVDGARAADVAHAQVPAFASRTARPDARYDLGCLYVGVNDVRAPDWDPQAFARDHAIALAALAERCDRLLVVTIPLDLGRPRAGERVEQANAILEDAAREHGALVLDLRRFGARNLVMTDHVHPTAFGQVWIAERALDVLAADGDRRARAPGDADPPRRGHTAAAAAGRLDLRLPERQGVGSGTSGSRRGSGAPSCASRLGT